MLPEERENAFKQVVQILPSRIAFSLRNIEAADALKIVCGIRAKSGHAGHFMQEKITEEIGKFR